ncbi:TVP38/TMEM64 family protein [Bacillaceae bacterium SIJ1]|uniref:TVP38/TMEM64 family protein n=1 Tax=Litoribacterium kuwaitense TaxID=1398745 RepID=UPI0013EB4B95|nr:TVP38/TMEM64 family protein [Litoribacterium kuwaitense]NGP44498.1 TVP38/TMEM64 family protein [Litoribacterium kuwaitense]
MREWLDEVNIWINEGNVSHFVEQYEAYPVLGFLLPFIEAFIPILPVVLFGLANAQAFGLLQGFILSWTGATAGAFCVFLIVRSLGEARWLRFIREQKNVKKMTLWVKERGFGPLFILLCFPFSPSSLINVVAALSRVSIHQFLLALMMGKAMMFFLVSYIGHDLQALITQPIRTISALLAITILWYIGKRIEKRLQMKVERSRER